MERPGSKKEQQQIYARSFARYHDSHRAAEQSGYSFRYAIQRLKYNPYVKERIAF